MLVAVEAVLTPIVQIQVRPQVLAVMAEVAQAEKLQQDLTEHQTLVAAPAPAVVIRQMVEVSVAQGSSSYVYLQFTQLHSQVG
jgi:hypothetical protein